MESTAINILPGIEWRFTRPGFPWPKGTSRCNLSLDGPALQGCLDRLGKYTRGKSCLYIYKLADIDPAALEELIQRAWRLDKEMLCNL